MKTLRNVISSINFQREHPLYNETCNSQSEDTKRETYNSAAHRARKVKSSKADKLGNFEHCEVGARAHTSLKGRESCLLERKRERERERVRRPGPGRIRIPDLSLSLSLSIVKQYPDVKTRSRFVFLSTALHFRGRNGNTGHSRR